MRVKILVVLALLPLCDAFQPQSTLLLSSLGTRSFQLHGSSWRQHSFVAPPATKTQYARPSSGLWAARKSSPLMSLASGSQQTPKWVVPTLCLIGIGLTSYALHIETMAKAQASFRAACDFGSVSCSRVAKSVYGTGLGLIDKKSPLGFLAMSNALYGMIYYVAMLATQMPPLRSLANIKTLIFFFSGMSMFTTVYLGYVLFGVIKDVCLVCISCYIVNAMLFVISWREWKASTTGLNRR